MDWNNLIFPIPKPSYSKMSFPNQIIWVPKKDYNYKDKLKYNSISYQSSQNILAGKKSKVLKKHTGKLIYHTKSTSMVQRVPSITFQIDNKFLNDNTSKQNNHYNINSHIPCLFLKSSIPTDKLLIYFHSNYEDLGCSYSFCNNICIKLKINVLAIEYPNYGIYKTNQSSNADNIINDANIIFQFITEVENIKEQNILLLGRCIGSGPATYLATKHNVMALILLSPFKSIKEAVKTMFPKLNMGYFLKNFVKERFNNYEIISRVVSPILFIHGKEDTVIPPIHSIDLIERCKAPAKLVIPVNMTHSHFDFNQDVIVHVRDFIKLFTLNEEDEGLNDLDCDGTDEGIEREICYIDFPGWMFKPPS